MADPNSTETTHTRSKAEQRMIRCFEKHGGRRFRILRSAETTMKQYVRPQPSVEVRQHDHPQDCGGECG